MVLVIVYYVRSRHTFEKTTVCKTTIQQNILMFKKSDLSKTFNYSKSASGKRDVGCTSRSPVGKRDDVWGYAFARILGRV